jgi:hypothetical protein
LLPGCHRTGLALSTDLDPDYNFYPEEFSCDYFTEVTFSAKLKNTLPSPTCNLFSVIHFNMRSLSRNYANLTSLLASVDTKFSVIGITETWLQNDEHSCSIEGYNFVHNHRQHRTGGGVGIYLDSNLQYKSRNDLSFEDSTIESLFIEICRLQGKNIIVGVVYRPPHQVNEFVKSTDILMTTISKENKLCYLMGDFNLDLMKYHCHHFTSEFLDIMYSNMFFPSITRPTRITSNTATLINNIFSNHLENFSFSGLLFTDISDHLPIFCIVHDVLPNVDNDTPIVVREKNANNLFKFQEQLSRTVWSDIPQYNDPQNAYDSFVNKFYDVFNQCFPLKRLKASRYTFRKPWMTTGLLKSIKRKNKLYQKCLRNPCSVNATQYKNYKNKLNHSIRIAKRLYYERKLEHVKSNTKNTWKILNEVINKKKPTRKLPHEFKVNNQFISNPKAIADRFCDYFTNIGPNLAKTIPTGASSFHSYLSGNFINSLFLEPTTEQEVGKIINTLRYCVASGYDNIPMWIVRGSSHLILEPLTHLINLSINSGIVPQQLKIARVVPIFKSGDNSAFSNYRPISVLPIFSKIFEKIVHNRITNYLEQHGILFHNQYGFRKSHSTLLALQSLSNKITEAVDKKKYTIGIFIDLSKAFDTVNHDILLRKLYHYGIRGLALDWIKNYLSGRKQFVEYNGIVLRIIM